MFPVQRRGIALHWASRSRRPAAPSPISMTSSASVLAQSHALDAEQQAFFHRHGYLILRALAGPSECAALLAAARAALEKAVPPVELEADLGYAGAPASREAE
ncbi:phytanoyl-CoA dioxygenase, partial [Ralstonia solanacearum]